MTSSTVERDFRELRWKRRNFWAKAALWKKKWNWKAKDLEIDWMSNSSEDDDQPETEKKSKLFT